MALPTISSNSPSAGSISWTGFGLQYDGVSYEIPAGSTDKKFTWWELRDGEGNAYGDRYLEGVGGSPLGTTTAEVPPVGTARLCSARDHYSSASTKFAVTPGEWITVRLTAKLVAGTRALRGGIWYIDRTSGQSWDSLGNFELIEDLGGGWGRYSRTFTVTSGKSTAVPYVQIDQSSGAYDTSWAVADVYVQRDANAPSVLSADTLPELAPEDLLLFLNRNGVGVLAPTAQVVDGSLIVSGSIIGDAIAANQIDAYHVKAGAITANAIAAGAVQAEALAAGVITTSKLSVGTISDNAVANGSFEDGTEGWTSIAAGAGASADVVTGVASAGTNALRLIRGASDTDLSIGQHPDFFIPVSSAALRRWYINARAGAASALGGGFNLIAYWWQADKTTPSAVSPATAIATDEALSTTWSDFEGQVTVPSDAHWMQIAIVNSLSGSTMFVDEVTALEVVVSAMIGDGQISAAKLAAGSVEAEAIAAGAVSAEAIAAGAIQANHIEAGSIQVSHLSPSVGENLDLSANGSITALAGQVNLIASDVGDTANQVSSMATALVVTPSNVQIVNSNSNYSFVITPEGAQITEGGVPRASWDAGRMVVPSMVVDGAIIGNHKWEKSGAGTIVRAL
jgi:hypothetical protein